MKGNLRKLAAQKMLQLYDENRKHIKQAQAMRLVYKQAELGLCNMPSSYSELQEKVASLCTQDLGVLEKALELNVGNYSLGTIQNNDPTNLNPSQQFLATMLGEL
jgi:hypothetical protein